MSAVLFEAAPRFEAEISVVIIGAGAAGLTAALAAEEAGADLLVLERDAVPRGSTALSAGLIPAAGTRFQRALGITDSAAIFAADIQRKAHSEADPVLVETVATRAGRSVEWLAERSGLAFSLVNDFSYPGHTHRRMHGLPSRSGAELVDRLRAAAEARGIPLMIEARVTALIADSTPRVRGVVVTRPDGTTERIGCRALILACCGYGANKALVARHIPAMAEALYFGHPGNEGDAVLWGEALGAELRHMTGHQGHGSVAQPHGILVTWAVIMEGGFQVNRDGVRFWNEAQGYSEAGAAVLSQPGGIAYDIFDLRIAAVARQFEDFAQAEAQGAVVTADAPGDLAARLKLPREALARSLAEVSAFKRDGVTDCFGRDWSGAAPLAPPYCAVRVTGALFHTQGGLAVDAQARVLRRDGRVFENLFAAGGAACGVSGPEASGYLSGNGLLTAVTLGHIAGEGAARLA